MHLISAGDQMKSQEIAEWVMKCQHPSGGFGGSINHDPHMLYTLSAVQILAILDRMELIDKDKVRSIRHATLTQRGLMCSGCTGGGVRGRAAEGGRVVCGG
eukprot:2509293-Rhodomonas_salina.1